MITRVRGGQDLQLRSFALTDMVRWGYDNLRNLTPLVNEKHVRGVPAIHRAARIRAEAIACLRLKTWRGDGPRRSEVTTVWQSRLFRGSPNEYQTRFDFWETVGESLAYRNNAYIWKMVDPLTMRAFELYALHPDQVQCDDDGYIVEVRQGFIDPVGNGPARYDVGEDVILHIRGHGQGGMREAPSPIQVFRESLEAPVARQRHENRVWRKGTTSQIAVTFPQGVSKDQADLWKESLRTEYGGTDGETTMMVGGGATIQPIGMTQADAQYAQMANLTVADASRIMGVPANLLGVQLERAVPNLEQDLALWMRTGLGTDLQRIESALDGDLDLFGPRSSVYPGFDTEGFVHGDVKTEAAVLVQLVQAGILLPDEARHIRGLDDLPGGAGKVPQITPVGGAPNPNSNGSAPVGSSNGNGQGADQ